MAGTELLAYDPLERLLRLQCVLLPDGTVRHPLGLQDWLFWETWGRGPIGWYSLLCTEIDETRVSTVFLGLDHDFLGSLDLNPGYQPLVFETMIFGGEHDGYQRRYRTLFDALAGHLEAEILAFHSKP